MNLYRSQQVYELDRLAIEQDGQPARQLMDKAAWAVWKNILQRWPEVEKVVVFAGVGNNGGDAFAIANLAREDGYQVQVFAIGDLARQSAESEFYRRCWEQAGEPVLPWSGTLPRCDLIVDGLLGIGLNKALNEDWQMLIQNINRSKAIRVCIDIPSGLAANRGVALPLAVKADLTVSFIGRKLGCFLADGPDYCGETVFDDLGLSRSARESVAPDVITVEPGNVYLPAIRQANSYKNSFGHVLVVGGGESMSGATKLAGLAALRCGSGLVSLCVQPHSTTSAAAGYAELMVSDWDSLPEQIKRATVVVAGPGLGKSEQASRVLELLAKVDKPMVIDADALVSEFVSNLKTRSAVLTPHPGEAARLLEFRPHDVQQDRMRALQQLTEQWPYVSVLKGAGTLIGQLDRTPAMCLHGHAGMATAGMGDVLAGMIAAYLAQGLEPMQASRTAVLLHALAADQFALEQGASCLMASDVIARIPAIARMENFQIGGQVC